MHTCVGLSSLLDNKKKEGNCLIRLLSSHRLLSLDLLSAHCNWLVSAHRLPPVAASLLSPLQLDGQACSREAASPGRIFRAWRAGSRRPPPQRRMADASLRRSPFPTSRPLVHSSPSPFSQPYSPEQKTLPFLSISCDSKTTFPFPS